MLELTKELTYNKTEENTCKWYLPCKYTKWKIMDSGSSRGWPVVIQQQTCVNCGKIKARRVSTGEGA